MSGNADVDKLLVLISQAAAGAVGEYQKYGQDVPSLKSPATHPLDSATDLVKLRMALRQLEGACHHLYDMLAPPVEYVTKNTLDFGPVLLRTAVEADIADVLDGHAQGLHLSRIAEATGLPQHKLTQIMRTLATRNCFIEVDTDSFANNRISQALRKDSETRSGDYTWLAVSQCQYGLDGYWEFLNDRQVDTVDVPADHKGLWSYARKNSAGELQDSPYTYYNKHPELMTKFTNAMVACEQADAAQAAIHAVPWAHGSSVCDIGSGVGSLSLNLAKLRPDMRITLQDQPDVLNDAFQLWSKEVPDAVHNERVIFKSLDFFAEPPVAGEDYYYMRAIVHNWNDDDVRKILTNVRQAMVPHSRLLIQEYSLAPQNRNGGSKEAAGYGIEQAPEPLLPNYGWGVLRRHNLDFAMQLTFNAKERTVGEIIELVSSVGLKFVKLRDLGLISVFEFEVDGAGETGETLAR